MDVSELMLVPHLPDYLESTVQDSCIFQMNDAAVGASLKVELNHLSVFVLLCSKIIVYGLFFDVQFLRDPRNAAVGECVFDALKFFESNIHMQMFK
jgi:hypothetical protein